jgi:NADH:ubiquinone oxidoreductase subunit 3 (subunit A)
LEYGMILSFLFFAVLFVAGGVGVNRLLMPFRPNKTKEATYECGIEPVDSAIIRYNIRFYVYALMYVVFSVEAVFLFPWAVVYKLIPGIMPLIEALIFISILILALAFAWKKGALKWD